MAPSTIAPIKQAFVKALRDITVLKTAVGGTGINEGVALHGEDYPYCVYNIVSATRSYVFGETFTMRALIDVFIVSDDQVEAHNLDQLIFENLQDLSLTFESGDEQSTLLCRRINDLSSADLDDAGKKVYQVGATYSIWTD